MNRTLWHNGTVFIPGSRLERGWLLTDDESGRIEAVGKHGTEPSSDGIAMRDVQGRYLLPGFLDVHIHGGNGFGTMDAAYASLEGISAYHAAHGTTSFLATTTTSSQDRICSALRTAADAVERGVSGAELLGIHLEGPFLNVKRRGAQRKEDIRNPTTDELDLFLDTAGGHIRLVTLAPEVEGGLEAVRYLRSRGVTVSAGHSDATYAEMADAIDAGVTHTTHHFNGMSPLHHREPGLAGAGLVRAELTTELIADGIHVHPAAVKLLFDVKTPDRVCLITDSVTCGGLPDGEYGGVRMTDGQIYLQDGTTLAGSSLTMIQALRNAVAFTGCPVETILPSLTTVPARQIGMSSRKGALEAGKDADFLITDESLNLLATVVRGKEVFRTSQQANPLSSSR